MALACFSSFLLFEDSKKRRRTLTKSNTLSLSFRCLLHRIRRRLIGTPNGSALVDIFGMNAVDGDIDKKGGATEFDRYDSGSMVVEIEAAK